MLIMFLWLFRQGASGLVLDLPQFGVSLHEFQVFSCFLCASIIKVLLGHPTQLPRRAW